MNVSHDDAFAELRWIGIGVEKSDAAIRCLLMTVVCYRADRNRERRESAGLPLVMASVDKMKQMIVRPMTRLDDRASPAVPRDAIRIARSFADDLELARARMHSPKRAIKFVFLAVVRANAALIEDTIEAVKPAIRPPRQRIRQLV